MLDRARLTKEEREILTDALQRERARHAKRIQLDTSARVFDDAHWRMFVIDTLLEVLD